MTAPEGLDRRAVAAFCRKWAMLPPGGRVLCAVSGGRDSMALLHLLKALGEREGFTLLAAHFNHQLRPTARRDEDFVRSWCGENRIPLTVGRGDVAAFARERGRSLEDAARELRYRFLEETAEKLAADRIATAHHRQDNAETVLLHLLRGTGLRGLTGIPPVRGKIVRPLLETDRREIEAYVRANGIPYVEDETNADPAYTRNRLRLEIMPLLEEVSPGCTARLSTAAEVLRGEEEHLDRETAGLLPPPGEALAWPVLLAQDEAIRRRLVRAMARRTGVELSARQTEAVLALGPGGVLDLPGGVLARRGGEGLTFRRRRAPLPPLVLETGEQTWGPWTVRVGGPPGPGESVALAAERALGPLTIACWDGRGRLNVGNGSRTIKRLFADRGIPAEERLERPALYLGDRPVAVFGVAVDHDLQPQPGEAAVAVTLERNDGDAGR